LEGELETEKKREPTEKEGEEEKEKRKKKKEKKKSVSIALATTGGEICTKGTNKNISRWDTYPSNTPHPGEIGG
jgi:hypothetical protein